MAKKKVNRQLQYVVRIPGEPDTRISAEQWLHQMMKQKCWLANLRHEPGATDDQIVASIKADKWVRSILAHYVELLGEKFARNKVTVTDEQIIEMLEKCGTQENAAEKLGISDRAIRKRLKAIRERSPAIPKSLPKKRTRTNRNS